MDSIKDSIHELTQHFNTKMAEFQQNLNSSIPATSPTSHVAAQFSSFRSFVLTALEGLQRQVQLLTKQQDNFEILSRRKMLLIHGVSEDKNEDLTSTGMRILSSHLKMPDLSLEDISRCHRLGITMSDKPRPILFKFRNLSLRNKIWFSKTNLKNSGFTLSEFLTKPRHDAFVAARQRFGISRCWTRDGAVVVVVGSDSKRHRITSISELNSAFNVSDSLDPVVVPAPPPMSAELKGKQAHVIRAKRTIKK